MANTGKIRVLIVDDIAESRDDVAKLLRFEPDVEVVHSLRMRPERIAAATLPDDDALDMLQATNSGHGSSMTTAHANSPRHTLSNLETMCLMAGMDLSVTVIRQ